MSYAIATILGHLGKDPITREVGDTTCTTLSVAATRRAKRQGADIEVTTWWRASIWGAAGLAAAKHLHKGDAIVVTGWPEERSWTDDDGAKHHACELVNAQWSFVPGQRTKAEAAPAHASTENPTKPEDAPF
jgi:single stranded DNA-binding protein